MKVRLLVVFLALGGLSSFARHSTAADPAARRGPLPRYRATLLRPLPRHQASIANAINEAGAAVGRSRSTAIDSDQATVWDAIVGAKWKLGVPPTAFRLDPAAR